MTHGSYGIIATDNFGYVEMYSSSNSLGVDATGAYEIIAGTKTYPTLPPDETNLSLVNGWINHNTGTYGFLRYYKHDGAIHIAGLVNGTTASADTITTMPAGYRPTATEAIVTNDAATPVFINTAGVVTSSKRGVLYMSGISYRHA